MIIIGIVVALALFTGYLSLPTGVTPGNVYAGRLKINFLETKRVDGSEYKIGPTQMRVIHGSMDYNDKVGTVSGGAGTGSYPTITGDVAPADEGVWFLIIDYGTNNTAWLDIGQTAKQQYVTRVFGFDGDVDGFDEDTLEMNFANLPPISEDGYREVEVNLVLDPARTSSVTCTSMINSTTVSTTAYSYTSATGYIAGFTEGDLARLAKLQLVFDDNATEKAFPDNTQWQFTHLKIGPYTWTGSQFGGYDLSNSRYQITFGDQVNWQGGKDLYYAKNAGTLWCSYELKAYCLYSAAGSAAPKLYAYLYEPDGSISSSAVFNRTITFSTS